MSHKNGIFNTRFSRIGRYFVLAGPRIITLFEKSTRLPKIQKNRFFLKEHNPANVPELRPIEDFWSELKRLVYDKNWKCNDLVKLKNRIEYSIKKSIQNAYIGFVLQPLQKSTAFAQKERKTSNFFCL